MNFVKKKKKLAGLVGFATGAIPGSVLLPVLSGITASRLLAAQLAFLFIRQT